MWCCVVTDWSTYARNAGIDLNRRPKMRCNTDFLDWSLNSKENLPRDARICHESLQGLPGLVNIHTTLYGKSPFYIILPCSMGKYPQFSMAIFKSYVSHYQRVSTTQLHGSLARQVDRIVAVQWWFTKPRFFIQLTMHQQTLVGSPTNNEGDMSWDL